MWDLPQKQNARRADKIRLCGHLRRYKKIVKKTYIILWNFMDIRYDSVKSNTVFYFMVAVIIYFSWWFFQEVPMYFSNKMYNRTIHYLKSKVRWLFNENNFLVFSPVVLRQSEITLVQWNNLSNYKMNTIVIFVLWMNMPLPFPKNRKSYASKFVV